MVAVSLRESPDVVREYAKDFGFRFRVWIDPDGAAAAALGVRGHPTTILIDRAGRIVATVIGECDWSSPEARRLVEWLLEEATPR